jgi:RND family efflux transporter MFP subunit
MKNIKFIFLLTISLFAFSCAHKQGKENKTEISTSEVRDDAPAKVAVMRLEYTDFSYEIISNGTIAAMNKANLRFQNQETVRRIYVKNGDRVAAGQALAELDKFKLQVALEQAKEAKDRTYLDLQDALISQGYAIRDSASVPPDVMRIAHIRSGYAQSENNYQLAAYNLREATLRAPFAGTVANLTQKEHNLPTGDAFCTVVDNSRPEVIFNILESELLFVKMKDKVIVSPFSQPDNQLEGLITEINPLVDKNGMVRLTAIINAKNQPCYEGMNVKVRIQRLLGKALVIPKTALTLRTNRKVVFTAKNGVALWNYVETAQENSTSYVITSGLSVGDSVVYDGNVNLAHEARVLIN